MATIKLSVDDPAFVEKIIFEVKAQGHFDGFRKECLADVDTQPAFQNLHSRVEDSVQKYLNRQVWTPETNKNRLREDMRYSIIRAGYLESGVSRIVDQVVEQKMDYIQSSVESILYQYVGMEKPIKKEKVEALEIETDLLPTDLEQVSPDSDKKSTLSDEVNMDEMKDEEVEEEVIEDDDFESPAFEPIEQIVVDRNETSQHSNLSAISGLTSQDSLEDKSEPTAPTEEQIQPQDTQLSQISSMQDISQEEIPEDKTETETTETIAISGNSCGEAQMASNLDEKKEETPTLNLDENKDEKMEDTTAVEEPEKSQFDLNKDSIEFTGNERKSSIQLDDSTNSGEPEKILQPHHVPSNTMEIDNLYENDTTDSSEMRMEIDLKDETTQETAESSKVEESSQDSSVSKGKPRSEHSKDDRHNKPKSDRSRDKHKSSSHKSTRHHHSSSSKSRHDDKHKSRSSGKSSSTHKKSDRDKDKDKDKERSSSHKRDHDKDRKSSKDDSSKSKPREPKPTDDHHQEKSSSRRRRSTDHDSNDGKSGNSKPGSSGEVAAASVTSEKKTEQTEQQTQESSDNKPVVLDKMLSENCEISFGSRTSSTSSSTNKKEPKSSILVKYDYLKRTNQSKDEVEDECCGFPAVEKLPENPWFDCLRNEATKGQQKKPIRRSSNNNYLEQKKLDGSLHLQLPKTKAKSKSKDSPDSPKALLNGTEETQESRAQTISQQQRYTSEDLYKPRFDFGNRSRRRGQVTEENSEGAKDAKMEDVSG